MRFPLSPVFLLALAVPVAALTACSDSPGDTATTPAAQTRPSPAETLQARDGLFRLPAIPLPNLESVVPDPPPPAPEPTPTEREAGSPFTTVPAVNGEPQPEPQPEPADEEAPGEPEEEPEDPPERLLSLADFAGRPLVVHFFASWCEPCRDEIDAWRRIVESAGAPAASEGNEGDGESESDETEETTDDWAIQTVGILEEQHPERAKLYLRWRNLDFPVLVDSLDLYQLSDLPVTLLVDRAGNARFAPPADSSEEVAEALQWMREEHPARGLALGPDYDAVPDLEALFERTIPADGESKATTDADLERYAQALFLWGGPELLSTAVESYESLLERDPDVDGWRHFRLGTAYRARYDSEHRRPGDFEAAVREWQQALQRAPHNEIFRRRIQQYGPRMTKPFSFYDWVPGARRAVAARGETPPPTPTLTASEIAGYAPPEEIDDPFNDPLARPEENLRRRNQLAQEAESAAVVPTDTAPLVQVEAVTVPAAARPGEFTRAHVTLSPGDGTYWQPGSQVVVRLQTPPEWRTGPEQLVFPTLNTATESPAPAGADGARPATPRQPDAAQDRLAPPATPTRTTLNAEDVLLELDLRIPDSARRGLANLPAEVLYNVCDEAGCRLLRRELPLSVEVDNDAPSLSDPILRARAGTESAGRNG